MANRMNTTTLTALAAVAIIGLMAARKTHRMNTREIIKAHEGWRATRYMDTAGYPTIGWGHKILPGENLTTITKEQGEALLTADIERTRRGILPHITRPMNPNEEAAAVSLAFNIGVTAFKNSTLLKKWNAGDTAGAAAEFLRWNKERKNGQMVVNRGLAARREKEKTLFLTA